MQLPRPEPQDDRFVVRPKPSRWVPVQRWLMRSGIAVVISTMSALFTGWQAYIAEKTRHDAQDAAQQARKQATEASDRQLKDVQEARASAAESAAAAKKLADGMERSASAAERSAATTQELVRLNARGLEITTKPLLTVMNVSVGARLVANSSFAPTFRIMNQGNGLATDVIMSTCVRTFETLPREILKCQSPDVRPLPPLSPHSISPPVVTVIPMKVTISTETLGLIEKHAQSLYFFGELAYTGVADPNKQYITRWCTLYNPASSTPDMLEQCPSHNYTYVLDQK